jgi:hypothetical protein
LCSSSKLGRVSTTSNNSSGKALFAILMVSANFDVPQSITVTKESTPLASITPLLALLGGLLDAQVSGSSFSIVSSFSTARGSFELFAYCSVATLLPKMVARKL